MEKSPEPVESSGKSQKQILSRHELLKLITASGVALAATSFFPEKWFKPAIETGVLPAHAQTTPTLRIVDVVIERNKDKTLLNPDCQIEIDGKAYYEDDYSRVGIDPTVLLHETYPVGNITDWSAKNPTNPSVGYIEFYTVLCADAEKLILTLQVGTRQSEPYVITFA